MTFRAEKLEQGKDAYWVVKNTNGEVVSQKFKNKTQALSTAADLNNDPSKAVASVAVVETVEVALPKNLSHRAVGMYQGVDGCWMVGTLPFDPTTGEAGPMKSERAGLNKLEGVAALKAAIGREVLKP